MVNFVILTIMAIHSSKSELASDRFQTNTGRSERRRNERVLMLMEGELSYGDFNPEVIGCRILDLSETGIRVETCSIVPVPEELSIRLFLNIEYRVRRRWAAGNQIGLEFIFDKT